MILNKKIKNNKQKETFYTLSTISFSVGTDINTVMYISKRRL